MIFETHAHYDDDRFENELDIILENIKNSGVEKIVNVGSSVDSCYRTVELVKKYDDFFGAIGIHPSDTMELNDNKFREITELFANQRIIAVGEIGLDYYYDEPEKDIQKKWFERQIELARQKNLPMIIHSRDAANDTLNIMKEHKASEIGGVIHCFSYSVEIAKEFLNMGFYFGIGGVLTFNNAKKLVEVVKYLPMDSIVIETDSPYLAPAPNRGKRNDSSNLKYVVEKIADIKGISSEEVENRTWDNAIRLYRL